jgi:tetraacyldisaccharide 4'-kinase
VARKVPKGLPVLRAELRPAAEAPGLAGERVLAFAGIARPAKFFATLRAAGAILVAEHAFADHRPYRRHEIETLLARAEDEGARCLTTAKDWVRLPDDLRAAVTVLPVELHWADRSAVRRLLETLRSSRGFTM